LIIKLFVTQSIYISISVVNYIFTQGIKNVPWHISAPAAVACDIYLIRRSVHPRGAFFTLQESNFL